MKFKVGDTVLVTAGKDKGKQGKILRVLAKASTVVVQGVNLYTRHRKPVGGQVGERVRRERALPLAKIAIWNADTKQADRLGYKIEKGEKVRIFKKTGKTV
jgi:large subunit ribosomal protein L24